MPHDINLYNLFFCSRCPVALCHGNFNRRQERSPSVIVIGGGMAGVAAARALHDASFQVFKLNSIDVNNCI